MPLMKLIIGITLVFVFLQRVSPSSNDNIHLNLLHATIPQLKNGLRKDTITPVQLVQEYLKRIDAVNHAGPELNAVFETNPDAIEIASEMDKKSHGKKALYGIPIMVKDNIATADKMNTTAGSHALVGSVVPRDAFVVRKLRDAGAIILGKATMSEWAGFRCERPVRNGVSGTGGIGRSAYLTDGDPSGSSSGSAIAVSVGLCAGALGTETDGSIISPASRNAIVGLKPTVGLTSRSGVIPISRRQDSVGPMAKTVHDVALILEVIQGADPSEIDTVQIRRKPKYRQFLKGPSGLKNIRLGVVRVKPINTQDEREINAVFDRAIVIMQTLGAIVLDPFPIPNLGVIVERQVEFKVLVSEFKADLEHYLQLLVETKVRKLSEIIDYNIAHDKKEILAYLNNQNYLIKSEQAAPLQPGIELAYLSLGQGIRYAMNDSNVDVLVFLPEVGAAVAAITGCPIISVPLGYLPRSNGVEPFGIAFMARAFGEGTLLQVAHAFEQLTHVRDQVQPKHAP